MRVLLAPMEGVIDSLVRELLTEVNDYDLCITEFLRVVDQLLPVKSFYQTVPGTAPSKSHSVRHPAYASNLSGAISRNGWRKTPPARWSLALGAWI